MISKNWHAVTAAALVASAGLFGGCDPAADTNAQADRAAVSSNNEMQKGIVPGYAEAIKKLDAASPSKIVDPSTSTVINGMRGDLHLDIARKSQVEAFRKQRQAEAVLALMRIRAEQILTLNSLIKGYRAQEPVDGKKALAGDVSAMQGKAGGQGVWLASQNAANLAQPTIAAIDMQIAKLQKDISDHQKNIDDLSAQREQSMTLADQQQQKSSQLKGDQSVAAYTQMADARQKAEDLYTQIDTLKSESDRLQSQLKVQQNTKQQFETGVENLQAQSKVMDEGFAAIQKQAQQQSALLSATVDKTDADPTLGTLVPLSVLSEQLTRIEGEIAASNEAALAQFKQATDAYAAAVKSAQDLIKSGNRPLNEDREGPEHDAWVALTDVLHPQVYNARLATVATEKARLLASQVSILVDVTQTRNQLKKALSPSNATLPKGLADASLDSKLTEAKTAADDAFAAASESLSNVTGGLGPVQAKTNGVHDRLVLSATWSDYFEVLARGGLMEAEKARTSGDEQMTMALDMRKRLLDSGESVPPYPGALGEVTAPGAATAANAATAPAGGETAQPTTDNANDATPPATAPEPETGGGTF